MTLRQVMAAHSSALAAPHADVVAETPPNVSQALVAALEELGFEHAFAILGGAIAPFSYALDRSVIEMVHFRHETGAVFAAAEAYFATGRPTIVVTTGGPGLSNALTGLAAAKWDGAKLLLISGATSAAMSGRWAFQESSQYALPFLEPAMTGALVDLAASLDDPAQLTTFVSRLEVGLARPGGFVAHLRLPLDVQRRPAAERRPRPSSVRAAPPTCSRRFTEQIAKTLGSAPFGIWVGFGARHASARIHELVERTGAAVASTPRAKGIFPEDHPRFVGVTGFGGHDSVKHYIASERPERMLVLGTRLGEFSSFWDPALAPAKGFIHVDIDPTVPGAAYPSVDVVPVCADVGAFLDALLECLPEAPRAAPPRAISTLRLRALDGTRSGTDRPRCSVATLMQAIQRVVVDGSDAVVIAEAGNSFAWSAHLLGFRTPGRYRASMGWASMGHAAAGVVGVAHVQRKKAVAVVGDGAMLMNSEVSTAVAHGVPAVWIVLNDARYGMIAQGLGSLGIDHRPEATEIPRCDFAAIARAMGADGVRVERDRDLLPALQQAMASACPFVVDVLIDPSELAPSGARFRSIAEQWKPREGTHE